MNSTAQRTVLVTGASGFVGRHLVRKLIESGRHVLCLVRVTSQVDELRALGAELITCDLRDPRGITRIIAAAQASVVFHLAGLVRALSPQDFTRVNVEGVKAIAAGCAEAAVHSAPPVLVLISSLAAAGPAATMPRQESDPPLPVSHYGRSKLAGEQAAARYARIVPITVVRPGVVFGAGDRGMYEMFKPLACSGIHFVPGRGVERLTLIAVADLIELIVQAAEKGARLLPGGAGMEGGEERAGEGIYFAAAGDLSYVELGHALAQALGKEQARIVRMPDWMLRIMGVGGDIVAQIRRRPGWLNRDKISEVLAGSWTCSSAKARRQLDWAPAATLTARLRETAEWYRAAHWL